MALLSRSEIDTLATSQGQWCVSIYMPTHRVSVETQQDRILFKDLLKQAQTHLEEQRVRTVDAVDLLRPAAELLDQHDFWQYLSDGLALFIAPGLFRHYRLPHPFVETVVVNSRLCIKPLLPLLNGDGQFYILALSQNQVRLLQGTRYSVDEIYLDGIPNLPKSIADTLKYDQFDDSRNLHTFSGESGATYGRTAIFHGAGSAQEDSKTNLRRFFHQVDDGLHVILANSQQPLVLAGVEYLHPIYREVNTYPHLVAQGIIGNPEGVKAQELHARALELLRPLFESPQQAALDAYRQLAGERSGRVSSDLKQIIPAAFYGRVGTLFVSTGAQKWGTFDPDSNRLRIHDERKRGDEDLIDLAAAQTIRNNGNVYAFDPGQMPDYGPAKALFRY